MKAIITALALSLSSGLALADAGHHDKPAQSGTAPQTVTTSTTVSTTTTTVASAMADGEIRKVDKDQKKLTIKHGELKTLEMPPMTMVFQVKDPAMLDQVKVGDKVRFNAERLNGAITVTAIEVAK